MAIPRCFDGRVFGLTGELPRRDLEAVLKLNGAKISAIIHKRVSFVVCTTDAVKYNTQKVRKAAKHGIPLVLQEFVTACTRANRVVDHEPFHVAEGTPSQPASPPEVLSKGQSSERPSTMLQEAGEDDAPDAAPIANAAVGPATITQSDTGKEKRREMRRERKEDKIKRRKINKKKVDGINPDPQGTVGSRKRCHCCSGSKGSDLDVSTTPVDERGSENVGPRSDAGGGDERADERKRSKRKKKRRTPNKNSSS